MKPKSGWAKFEVVHSVNAGSHLESFLVSAVAAVLATRVFLLTHSIR